MGDDSNLNDFIKLDRDLIRVLGLNKAVIFCHLQGIENAINRRISTTSIYQTIPQFIFATGLSKSTIIKSLKELEQLNLIYKLSHAEGNKTRYKVNKVNTRELNKIIKKTNKNKFTKNSSSLNLIQQEVLKSYHEYLQNHTTSSTNFDTTNKELIKENKGNRLSKKDLVDSHFQQSKNDNDLFSFNNSIKIRLEDTNEIIEYYHIKSLFSKKVNIDTIKNIISTTKLDTLNILEYFTSEYEERYNKPHPIIEINKLEDIIKDIEIIYSNYAYYDIEIIYEIIDQFFEIKNKDLTLMLFTSKNCETLEYEYPYRLSNRLM